VLATLLNEMDGIDGPDSGIVVVGTSNRIDSIDAALLRLVVVVVVVVVVCFG
jgi:ATP-dependent Zn protease